MRGFVAFNLGERFVGKSDSSLNLEIQTIVSRDRLQTGSDFQDLGPTQNRNHPTAFSRAMLLSFPKIKAIYIYICVCVCVYIYVCVYTHTYIYIGQKNLMQYYNFSVKVENKI